MTEAARVKTASPVSLRWLLTCGALLAIPSLALWMTRASLAGFEAYWLQALTDEVGAITPEQAAAIRLSVVCADPSSREAIGGLCTDFGLAGFLDVLAIVALIAGLGLVVLLVGARLLAPRLGIRLGMVFRPALYVLLVGLLVLCGIGSIAVVGGLYVLQLALTQSFYPYVIVIGAVTGLGLVVGCVRALMVVRERPPFRAHAIEVDRATQPNLFAAIDSVAMRIGTQSPDHVLVGMEPTFWVTELPIRTDERTFDGRSMFVSLPMSRILEQPEFEAVIGHELAHFHGGDTDMSRTFYPIYAGSTRAFEAFIAARGALANIVSLIPANALGLFFDTFSRAERGLSRARELAADDAAAAVTSRDALRRALIKLAGYTETWEAVWSAGLRRIRWEQPPGNLSTEFASLATPSRGDDRRIDEDAAISVHPTDSHPPLPVRLGRLAGEGAATTRSVVLPPIDPAIDLVSDPACLESDLIARWAALVATEFGRVGWSVPDGALARPDHALRKAAMTDPFIAGVVDHVEGSRGVDLARAFDVHGDWIALADLEIAPDIEHPTATYVPGRRQFATGDPVRIVALADRTDTDGLVVPAGARLTPLGFVRDDPARPLDLYLLDDQAVAVAAVGDWTIEEQLAGLFVVPADDPLIAGLDSSIALLGDDPEPDAT